MFLVYIWYPFLRELTNGRLKKLQTAAVLPLDAIQDDIGAHSINIEHVTSIMAALHKMDLLFNKESL